MRCAPLSPFLLALPDAVAQPPVEKPLPPAQPRPAPAEPANQN